MSERGLLPYTEDMMLPYEEALVQAAPLLSVSHWEKKIVSYQFRSKQQKSKKKGFSVALVCLPKTKIAEEWYPTYPLATSEGSNVYARITLYNEIDENEKSLPQKTHFIPVKSLAKLFRLAHAIREGSLYDLHERHWSERGFRRYQQEETVELRAYREQVFYERTGYQQVFSHDAFIYGKNDEPKSHLMFFIGVSPKNTISGAYPFPWELACMEVVYNAHPISRSAVERVEERTVYVSQEQLLNVVEEISQTLCQLPEDLRKLSLDKEKES